MVCLSSPLLWAQDFVHLSPARYPVGTLFTTQLRNAADAVVEYPEYEPLTRAEVKQLHKLGLEMGAEPIVHTEVGIARKQRLLDVSFLPIIKRAGRYYRLTSVRVSPKMRPGVAKLFHILPKDPNSGLFVKLSGGWWMQKTVFSQDMNESEVPQLMDDYQHLYDHLRHGVMLTESIGFAYMSNLNTYINVKISFDISQCWSWSSRPYTIDNVVGLNGKDENRYFDLMFGIKLSWLFPITGRTSYDYYYY